MKRLEFIKKLSLTSLTSLFFPSFIQAKNKVEDAKINKGENIGFNHLPNNEIKRMNKVIHRANTRGTANHGWLQSKHTFSFANYHNPERMHFGVLRVLNDDQVDPGQGFGKHPHNNMEIISIPLEGDLEHKDSIGNTAVIKEGDVQVMSAGTGIYHSEYNKNNDKPVKFLQIWVFPNKKEVNPRYDQISLKDIEEKNTFYQILSPNANDQGVWIHQDAWFSMGKFENPTVTSYKIKKESNGVYVFLLEGEAEIDGEKLEKRDSIGIWNTHKLNIKTNENTKILLMDIPMNL